MHIAEDTWDLPLLADGVPVAQGRELRALLVLQLLAAEGSLSVGDLVAGVERAGFTFVGRPGKVVSDALRWEVRRGRVAKTGRGRYRSGYVAKSSRHGLRRRVERLHQARRRACA